MRAALDWFRHLPTLSRRSILIKGLLAAAVAFVICMGVVWGAEKVIGNSLSAASGRSVLTVPLQASTPQDTAAPVRDLLSRAVARIPRAVARIPAGSKGQASSTAYARTGTRSETANPSSGEATTNPSSGIHGTAGIRVALRHQPPRPGRRAGSRRPGIRPAGRGTRVRPA